MWIFCKAKIHKLDCAIMKEITDRSGYLGRQDHRKMSKIKGFDAETSEWYPLDQSRTCNL